MAKVHGDNAEGGREPEVRQQKLPMFRRVDLQAPAPAVADEPVSPVADSAPSPAVEASAPPLNAPPPAVAVASPAVPAAAPVAPPSASGVGDPPPPASEPAVGGEPGSAVAPVAGGVGDLLLSARADSGLSIEAASAGTRIPRDVIEHLECNAYGQLPPEYYCKAHIEKLSKLYNVDSKPILQQFHADMLAQHGPAEGLGHFHAVTTDSESGSKISYVLPGPGSGGSTRAVSLTGKVVSGVIALLLLIVVAALAAQHFRNRQGAPAAGALPAQVGHAPAVDLKEFIVTEELNAYELPIPAK
jgi:hypothetical protein